MTIEKIINEFDKKMKQHGYPIIPLSYRKETASATVNREKWFCKIIKTVGQDNSSICLYYVKCFNEYKFMDDSGRTVDFGTFCKIHGTGKKIIPFDLFVKHIKPVDEEIPETNNNEIIDLIPLNMDSDDDDDDDDDEIIEPKKPEPKKPEPKKPEPNKPNRVKSGTITNYTEIFDVNKLAYIIENKDVCLKKMRPECYEDKYDPFLLPERYLRKSVEGKCVVNYKQVGGVGRYFANGGLSMQSFAREIRHSIAKDLYVDIDMVNAHPTIFSFLCKKLDIDTKYLDKYIKNRDKVIKELMDKNDEGVDIKKMILSVLNGGSASYEKISFKTKWLLAYRKEIIEAHNKICDIKKDEFNEYKKIASKKHNIQASFINKILCDFENNILKHMIDFYNIKDKSVCVLCFDGVMLPKGEYDLRGCEKYISDKLNIKIKLKFKQMDEGFDIPEKIEQYNSKTFKWSKSANNIFEILMKDTFNESFSDETVANAFTELMKGDVIVINNDGDGYQWNDDNKLWEMKTSKSIMRTMTLLDGHFSALLDLIKKQLEEAEEDMKKYYFQMLKNTQAYRKRLKSTRGMKDAYFIASTDLYDDKFEEKLNMKHHLLPIKPNRTIDMTTGICRDRTRDDLFSVECPVEFVDEPDYVNVNKYMSTTFCENQELIDYMQERMGVFLTGETLREIEIWYGCGKNGKTTTSELLRQIMGKFFCTINKAVFIEDPKSHQAKGASHTSHLIPMIGKRLGMSSEVKEGDEFNTTMLKGLSGGDPITYREAYCKDEKTFVSHMKGVLMTNPKPQFDFEDKALIDRLRYIHFNARFVDEPNPNKPNEYLASGDFINLMRTTELNNFFTYLVHGAVRFYKRGKKLITPNIVMAAKLQGLKESNRVGRFVEDCCVVGDDKTTSLNIIQSKFDQYLRDNGEVPTKRGELSKGLIALNFHKWKSSGVMMFKGVAIDDGDDDE